MRIINSPGQSYIPVKEPALVTGQQPVDKNQVPALPQDTLLPEEKNIKREELDKAVDKLQQAVNIFNKHFKFNIHDKTHRIIVQVIDSRTNEVVGEIPPEKILDMVADLQNMVGVIIDKKA